MMLFSYLINWLLANLISISIIVFIYACSRAVLMGLLML